MSRTVPLALLLISVSTAAHSQEASLDWQLTGTLGVISDYRDRGVSLSDREAAVQGGATLSNRSGAYASVWASTVDEYGVGADGKGATVEVDVTLGWSGLVGALDLDFAAARYAYPGGVKVDYWEFPMTASRAFSVWRFTAGYAYAPAQTALAGDDNHYVLGAVELAPEDWPVRLTLQAGYERGAFAPVGKWDWSARLSRAIGPVELAVTYANSDQSDRLASGGAILSLIATF